MDDMEQQVETFIESTPQKPKHNFWKGALCGALSMLVICVIVIGASGILKKEGGDTLVDAISGESLVSDETADKLKTIREFIDKIYLYSDDIDEKALQENIIRGYDGKLYFEDKKPDDAIYKKETEILELKQKYSEEIYKVYPISKQIDILGRISEYTDEDFEEMKNFIEEKIKKYHEEKEKI